MRKKEKSAPIPDEVQAQARVALRPLLVFSTFVALLVGLLIGYYGFQTNPSAQGMAMTPPPDWQIACVPNADAVPRVGMPTALPATLSVYVTGAVRESQVVTVPGGSLIKHALDAAGGPSADADLEALNLAKPLSNNDHIIVPRLKTNTSSGVVSSQTATGNASSDATVAAAETPVNINTASAEELESLPHIGPTRAEQIIAYREENGPFAHIEDIQNISGIGPATYQDLAPLITVGP